MKLNNPHITTVEVTPRASTSHIANTELIVIPEPRRERFITLSLVLAIAALAAIGFDGARARVSGFTLLGIALLAAACIAERRELS